MRTIPTLEPKVHEHQTARDPPRRTLFEQIEGATWFFDFRNAQTLEVREHGQNGRFIPCYHQ